MDYINRPPWVSGGPYSQISLPTLHLPQGYITFRMELEILLTLPCLLREPSQWLARV